MGYAQLAEGGANPIVITESGGRDDHDKLGGGVIAILFVLVIIVIAVFGVLGRREPIADRDSNIAHLLPTMMVAMANAGPRQIVDIDSGNRGGRHWDCGPTNFDIYRQGVATNDNVFVQSCQTRELVHTEGEETRDLINANRMHDLELQVAAERSANQMLNTQLTSERQYNSLVGTMNAQYNSLQAQLNTFPRAPVPAYCVSPYGAYHMGGTRVFHGEDGCARV